MRWPAIMGISIAAHAVVIVALPGAPARAKVAPVVPVVTIEPSVPPMATVPLDVVLLDPVPLPQPALDAPVPGRSGTSAPTHRGSHLRATTSGAATATAAATETGSRFSRMRFPSAAETAPAKPPLDLSLSGSVLDEIMNRPVPEIPTPTGELRANQDGSYTKNDSVFVATIAEDGTVSFVDKPNFHVGLKLPSIRAWKKHLARWAEDPYGETPGDVDEGEAQDDEDDDVFIIPIIVGGFDLTDAAMRAIGDDPYSAKKAAFLERTFEERAEIGRKHRKAQYEHAEAYALGNADELWDRADLSIAEKRELLFELWDECAETGEPKLVDAGERARAALLRFISVHLPSGSDDAYTADEIRTLDQRRSSTQHFAPY